MRRLITMKKIASWLFGVSLFAVAAFPVTAQKASINYRFNTKTDDNKNYFDWSADGKTVKDGFDAASGASKAKSTTEFNIVRFDSTGKKQAVPAGLRALMLYPVAAYSVAVDDALTAVADGKKVVITFVHRGTAYKITSDDKGKVSMSNSFLVAQGVGTNVGGKFMLKDEFLKTGGDKNNMADLDWSKVTLQSDTADTDADYTYTGLLDVAVNGGILTLKGDLKKAKK
jgi:hypothetical protein